MARAINHCACALSKLGCIFWLASAIIVQPASATIIYSHGQEPAWITQALKSGALDQKTMDLMRRPLTCRPEDCLAAWARATNWLGRECQSVELTPDFGNDVLKFKNATGVLKKYPDIKVSIWMKTRSTEYVSQIEIEHFDHYGAYGGGLAPEQLILDAKIFADFKSYVLNDPKGGQ